MRHGKARTDLAVLSYRVAMRWNCFRRLNMRSMRLRSRQARRSQMAGSRRVALNGMAGRILLSSESSRMASLSYPLSASMKPGLTPVMFRSCETAAKKIGLNQTQDGL